MGPTYTEPVATVPDTTTEHTAPEDHTTHVTNPTQEQQEGHGPMPTNAAPSNSNCKRTVAAHSGPEDATVSGRAQQVGGGGSGWIGDTFYDDDDDEPVHNREQPTGHDTRSEPPPDSIQPPPLTNNPTRPFRGLGLDTGGDAWLHLEQLLTAAVQHSKQHEQQSHGPV
jgi:hypothetical protein